MLTLSSLKSALPWWARIGTKVALARLPIPYQFWKRIGLFAHGDMNEPQRAFATFVEHARTAGALDESTSSPYLIRNQNEFNVLELGPGDSLFTAVIAAALGASRSWLVDSGAFATSDISTYRTLFDFLRQHGYALPINTDFESLDEILKASNCEYFTGGVRSLSRLQSGSIDFCFSNAVLEHVPKAEFQLLADELFRLLKPNGISVHRVDLKDHLGGNLNNLRFSEATWEGALFRKSGFYTNRIRFREMIGILEKSGFSCSLPRVTRWTALPLPLEKLNAAYRHLRDEDLLVSGFDIVLTRRQ